ncbi:hypothetical protein D3C85_273270 [compost metagenome]
MSNLLKMKPAIDFLRKQTAIVLDGVLIEQGHFGLVENHNGVPALVYLPRTVGALRVIFIANDQVNPSVWTSKEIPQRFRGTAGGDIEEAVAVFNRQEDFKILMVISFGKPAEVIWELNPLVVREMELALLSGRIEADRWFLYLDEVGRTQMLILHGTEYYVVGKSMTSGLLTKLKATALQAEQIRKNEPWTGQ